MSSYFSSVEAAQRYNNFRPQVHDIAAEWLGAAYRGRRFSRAVDLACGTGHSIAPLLRVAEEVEGIDHSSAMLAFARQRGYQVQCDDFSTLQPARYDLVSMCMALHWFDPVSLVSVMRRISSPGACWLLYNFGLTGHKTDNHFNDWYRGWYAKQFPAPSRRSSNLDLIHHSKELVLEKSDVGQLEVNFDRSSLIGYLTTQSNVENQIKNYGDYMAVERAIDHSLPKLAGDSGFVYGFSYSIFSFNPSQPSN